MEVIGVDHIYLSVSDFEASERFYDEVMQRFGFKKGDKAIGGDPHAHYFNRSLQVSIRPSRSKFAHEPYAPGLHHLCFQVPTRADVDEAAKALQAIGVDASDPSVYPEYNPDYYATFFSDPDGIRHEIVARTPARDYIVEHWEEFETFLNPVAALRAREK